MAKAFVIRDDDTCFHTYPYELTDAFGDLWNQSAKVSLSVIPYTDGQFGDMSIGRLKNGPKRYFYENQDLLKFLNAKIQKKLVEPVIHGFDHEYIKKDGNWISEFRWKNPVEVKKNLKDTQNLFSEYFGCSVNTLVPPSNGLSKDVSIILDDLGINTSSVIEIKFNRRMDLYSLKNFWFKIYFRLIRRQTVPILLKYQHHNELAFNNLTPSSKISSLYKNLSYCNRKNIPFVISTHYWELNQNPKLRTELKHIYEHAKSIGFKSEFLSNVLQ